MLGGVSGGYVELLEFDSMADFEKHFVKAQRNKEHWKFVEELTLFVVPGTSSTQVWSSVE